jgi:hypothetical protein
MKLRLIPTFVFLLALPGLAQDHVWRRVDQRPSVPSELTVPTGTLISVRIDQMLSSDLNQAGDAFSATLVQPIVVDGIVVSNRGQVVSGLVVEVQKAGRVQGTSRLGVELTELTLADGQQVPVETRFVNWRGPTSGGRDAAAIAGTAGLGGIAEGGLGAGIGAAAGAAAGGIGVLLTRGRPAELYPESVLTFRTECDVAVSTGRAPLAFRQVTPDDYARAYEPERHARVRYYDRYPRVYVYSPYPPPYAYGFSYPYYPYPYWWGPRFGFGFFYGRRW